MLYQITDGTVSAGGHVILSHVDFEIKGNEKIALVGRNGAGKTTLLKLIAGELSLDREASRVILTTNQAVRDLKIQSGSYDGSTFTPTETVFAAGAMNASQAVSIQADLENAPLLLTYRSGEEIIQRVLTMENGVPVLKK